MFPHQFLVFPVFLLQLATTCSCTSAIGSFRFIRHYCRNSRLVSCPVSSNMLKFRTFSCLTWVVCPTWLVQSVCVLFPLTRLSTHVPSILLPGLFSISHAHQNHLLLFFMVLRSLTVSTLNITRLAYPQPHPPTSRIIHRQVHLPVPYYDFFFLSKMMFSLVRSHISSHSLAFAELSISRSDGRCVQTPGTSSMQLDELHLRAIPRSKETILTLYPK